MLGLSGRNAHVDQHHRAGHTRRGAGHPRGGDVGVPSAGRRVAGRRASRRGLIRYFFLLEGGEGGPAWALPVYASAAEALGSLATPPLVAAAIVGSMAPWFSLCDAR